MKDESTTRLFCEKGFMEDLLEKYRNNNAFSVPDGYFDELPEQVLRRIAESSDSVSAEFSLEDKLEGDFPVPGGYFDALPDLVMGRIAAGEAEKLPATFAEREGESDFPVPAGYFDELPQQVMARIQADETRKLFLRRRLVRITSAAASVCLLLGVGAFVALHLNNADSKQQGPVARVIMEKSKPVHQKVAEDDNTLNLETALAYNSVSAAEPSAKSQPRANNAFPATDARTDKFINDNLVDEELDEVDYEILDFYTDDIASYDVWGF